MSNFYKPAWRYLKNVGLARLSSYFLVLAHKKVTKEEGTPCRLTSAALLIITGGHQTHPNGLHKTQTVAEFGQVMTDYPRNDCAARRGRGD